jgi:PAT family beta-lactamase induction signal transducer AmpG
MAAARYGLYRQLASVLVLIVLLVSVPAMFTQFFRSDINLLFSSEIGLGELLREDRATLRFLLYSILTTVCLSRMGRRGLAPVLTPVNDFILRYRWQALLLLGLIATYRMSDTVMGVMANVFYIDMGFAKSQIASVSKLFGLVMTLLGAALGGLLIVRFGIMPILLLGGAASAGTNLLFATLSGLGAVAEPLLYGKQTVSHLVWALDPHMLMLVLTITLDNLSSGLATAAFVAYLSSLTNLKFSATQYALLSSIMLLLPRLVGGYSGVMVEKAGYAQFFLATALLGIPTLLLIVLQWGREHRERNNAAPAASEAPK